MPVMGVAVLFLSWKRRFHPPQNLIDDISSLPDDKNGGREGGKSLCLEWKYLTYKTMK